MKYDFFCIPSLGTTAPWLGVSARPLFLDAKIRSEKVKIEATQRNASQVDVFT